MARRRASPNPMYSRIYVTIDLFVSVCVFLCVWSPCFDVWSVSDVAWRLVRAGLGFWGFCSFFWNLRETDWVSLDGGSIWGSRDDVRAVSWQLGSGWICVRFSEIFGASNPNTRQLCVFGSIRGSRDGDRSVSLRLGSGWVSAIFFQIFGSSTPNP